METSNLAGRLEKVLIHTSLRKGNGLSKFSGKKILVRNAAKYAGKMVLARIDVRLPLLHPEIFSR